MQTNYSHYNIINNLVYVREFNNKRVSLVDTIGSYFHCFGIERKEVEKESSVVQCPMQISTDNYVVDSLNDVLASLNKLYTYCT